MNYTTRIFIHNAILAFLILFVFTSQPVIAFENNFGVGLLLGINQVDGDWKSPDLTPVGGFALLYRPSPFLKIAGACNYSQLKSDDDPSRLGFSAKDSDVYHTNLIPLELIFQFNVTPLSRISPFVGVGGGWFWWKTKLKENLDGINGENKRKIDPFLKTSGGLEIVLTKSYSFTLGADFRYSFSDLLDRIDSGDENDAVVSVWTGLNYYFKSNNNKDIDGDFIPNELDLEPENVEDFNGYMDHDGRPERGLASSGGKNTPIVVHHPVFQSYENRNIKIDSKIYSKKPLRTAALFYRVNNKKPWNVIKLDAVGNNFTATIPTDAVTNGGLDYCIIAVDKDVKGFGYAGLPQRPIHVNLIKNVSTWQIMSSTLAAISWGSAIYIGLRKQKN